jgi:hypothetical protein
MPNPRLLVTIDGLTPAVIHDGAAPEPEVAK